jgi:putative FmdB family regulatory protein
MPTYDYVCSDCDHSFELFQMMSDPVKRKCPECGTRGLRRLIGTGAGVIFRGSGFYETDYRSDSYKKAADAEKKSADGPSGTSSSAEKGAASGSANSAAAGSSATSGAADSGAGAVKTSGAPAATSAATRPSRKGSTKGA